VDFRTTTQGQLARSMEIADLTDNATTLRREAESLLESQPLFAITAGRNSFDSIPWMDLQPS